MVNVIGTSPEGSLVISDTLDVTIAYYGARMLRCDRPVDVVMCYR